MPRPRTCRCSLSSARPNRWNSREALGQDSDVARGKAAGADDYFIKPFSPNQLLRRVYEVAGLAAA